MVVMVPDPTNPGKYIPIKEDLSIGEPPRYFKPTPPPWWKEPPMRPVPVQPPWKPVRPTPPDPVIQPPWKPVRPTPPEPVIQPPWRPAHLIPRISPLNPEFIAYQKAINSGEIQKQTTTDPTTGVVHGLGLVPEPTIFGKPTTIGKYGSKKGSKKHQKTGKKKKGFYGI